MTSHNSCTSTVENLVDPVVLNHVNIIQIMYKYQTRLGNVTLLHFFLALNTEVQFVDGKQYSDLSSKETLSKFHLLHIFIKRFF